MAQGGKSMQDRELASEVRSMVLSEIKAVFEYQPFNLSSLKEGEDLGEYNEKLSKDSLMSRLKEQLILKMSTSILPRLNELTGADGEPLTVIVPSPVAETFNISADK